MEAVKVSGYKIERGPFDRFEPLAEEFLEPWFFVDDDQWLLDRDNPVYLSWWWPPLGLSAQS